MFCFASCWLTQQLSCITNTVNKITHQFHRLNISTHSQPPCQAFSPLLKEFYKHVAQNVEIIYISSDRALEDFEAYFGTMPWLSLPAVGTADIKNQLAQTCKITGIPALLVLERATGHYVTNQNARQEVEKWKNNGGDKQGALRVVEQWKASPAVPLNEANLSAGGPGGIMGIVSMIAKNPAIVFGLIYIVKVRVQEKEGSAVVATPTGVFVQLSLSLTNT